MYRHRNAIKAKVCECGRGGYLCYNIVKEFVNPIAVKDLHCSQLVVDNSRVQTESSASTDFLGLIAVYWESTGFECVHITHNGISAMNVICRIA